MSTAQQVRVAVLDGHALVATALGALLERYGLGVATTASTWDALIAHPALPVDVVVLDLHLHDGLLIGRRVRELSDLGMATVVVSRRTDAASVATAMRAGALAFVSTTDAADELVTAIRTAARGGQHLADDRARAARAVSSGLDVGLGRQEERAIVLYASGRSVREVAQLMVTTEETVKSYIKRARRKYTAHGIDLGTRQQLRHHAAAQGWHVPD